jgi:hypothetical protein
MGFNTQPGEFAVIVECLTCHKFYIKESFRNSPEEDLIGNPSFEWVGVRLGQGHCLMHSVFHCVQVTTFWGADQDVLESLGWKTVLVGPQANAIALAGVTVKAGPAVGQPMPRLDEVVKLASAMVLADKATRHLHQAWERVLRQTEKSVNCLHPAYHTFPSLPLVAEGGVHLFSFPCLEMCRVCGLPQAAYPPVPHTFAEVGYPKLKK